MPSGAGRARERAAVNVHDAGHGGLPSHGERWAPRCTTQRHVWKRVVSALSLSLTARRVHEQTRVCQAVSPCTAARPRLATPGAVAEVARPASEPHGRATGESDRV